MKKHNFSSGPAILPASVMEEAAKAVVDLDGIGLSILEMSHRSKEFTAILNEAVSLVHELLEISDDYSVLYLTGGASSQFYMTALNLLDDNETAAYLDTGAWSVKAIKEAVNFGAVEVVASSKDKNYTYVPKSFTTPSHAKYLHITSNNTIYGNQIHRLPDVDLPIVADMSSDIFSKKVDIKRYGLIYAGAQKNLGPAGTTLVIVRKDMLGKVQRTIPTMLDYRTHIKKNSAFNTPPVFPIYVCMLTLRWLKAQGGVAVMNEKNSVKADLLYKEIDDNPFFTGPVAKEDRSIMNCVFTINNKDLEGEFLKWCEAADISGIKGHRSVGGFRASMYNAMPIDSTKVLVNVMQEFAKKFG